MYLDQLTNYLVTVTLIEMMVLTGLSVTLADCARTFGDWRLIARAALANYLLVPAAAIALLTLFDADPMVAAGFMVLAACPGAPFGPPIVGIAKGNVPAATGLMILLAGGSALVSPILLRLLLPWVSGGEGARIDLTTMLAALFGTQLLPLLAGLLVRHQRPLLADRLQAPLDRIGKVLGLSVVALILGTQFQMLANIRALGFVGMLTLLAATLAIGWLAGPADSRGRRAMALVTALRNVGVGLVIVTGSFAGTPAVSAALAYGIVEVLGSLAVAVWWRRRSYISALHHGDQQRTQCPSRNT